MTEQITIGGQTVTRVLFPDEVIVNGVHEIWQQPAPGQRPRVPMRAPWFRSVDLAQEDAVAITRSIFTGQTQAFEWPGAEMWTGTMTLPPLTPSEEAVWRACLLQCRGMTNAFLLGDDRHEMPSGNVDGRSTPVCATVTPATDNLPMSKLLLTRGWVAGTARLLHAGDYLQIGYRLHQVLDDVSSDGSGNATIEVWPSLREQPADAAPIIIDRPRGLFRRASNKLTDSYDVARLSSKSFAIMEWR